MNLGFKQKIALSSGVFLGISLFIFAVLSFSNAKSNLRTEIEQTQLAKTHLLKFEIESWLNAQKLVLEVSAEDMSLLPALSKDAAKPYLITAQKKTAATKAYMGVEDTGLMIYHDNTIAKEGYDPRKRPWYIKAKAEGKSIVTDVYTDASTGNPTISVAAPLFVKGILKGVVSNDVFLTEVVAKINATKVKGGYAFATDATGKINFHPKKEVIGKTLFEVDASLKNLEPQVKKDASGVYDYEVDGEARFLVFNRLENGWTI